MGLALQKPGAGPDRCVSLRRRPEPAFSPGLRPEESAGSTYSCTSSVCVAMTLTRNGARMTGPAHPYLGPSGETGPVPADVIELIMADHRRIGRLSDVLYDAARRDGGRSPDWIPGHVWQRLADLLVIHTRAEEQICYLSMFGSGARAAEQMRDSVADHDDIREVIGEASVQSVGSVPWWRAVRTVIAVSAEHLEREERDILPGCLLELTMSRRKELGGQWCAFIAAWRRDDATPLPPQGSPAGGSMSS
jgi:Hemerythrin HHE cation binding domain